MTAIDKNADTEEYHSTSQNYLSQFFMHSVPFRELLISAGLEK